MQLIHSRVVAFPLRFGAYKWLVMARCMTVLMRNISVHGENDEKGRPLGCGFGGCAIGRKTGWEPAPRAPGCVAGSGLVGG